MKTKDVFICHASDDKERFVRPLALTLRLFGVDVWFDEFSIGLGQSISEQIDIGIRESRFGLVIISPSFMRRKWTKHELRGLVGRDVAEDLKILPVWHGVTHDEVLEFSSSLADKMAIKAAETSASEVAVQILRAVRPDLYEKHARSELIGMTAGDAVDALQSEIDRLHGELAEYRCPFCSAPIATRIDAPVDESERDWDLVETYNCGYKIFAGEKLCPCPADPEYPQFVDYDISCRKTSEAGDGRWICEAFPKTEMARKVRLDPGQGRSEAQARSRLEATYHYRAGKLSNDEWFKIQTG